ncbi:GIY-YIG nuclease family protein [Sphingobacterium thalpophilum]|uniref:hypothetical protein n=1 Tax=Sphingobacterium thalpophilum TaxID=259 RepID=UPI002D767495|nr:hypothetical protein [Sphingobacterium thalpophilum]
MIVNSIYFERLSFWKQYYRDTVNGIPEKSGIYYWVYWPDFDAKIINENDLSNLLRDYSQRHLFFKESLKGRYKFEADIYEQGYPNNGNLFGLPFSKATKLINYFKDYSNRVLFHEFFKEVCFSRPFYVGKAKNLRNRLGNQHFKETTEVLPEITSSNINFSDIWVGYKIIPDPGNEDINTIFEEILSRKVKPGLTLKPN